MDRPKQAVIMEWTAIAAHRQWCQAVSHAEDHTDARAILILPGLSTAHIQCSITGQTMPHTKVFNIETHTTISKCITASYSNHEAGQTSSQVMFCLASFKSEEVSHPTTALTPTYGYGYFTILESATGICIFGTGHVSKFHRKYGLGEGLL
ncbi:hypothetical protein ES702_02326 [subsurface metagenome]